MEYTALYRKFRPADFSSVIGQKAIVKTLRNQIINQRVSHAYLFCGTRGTGKTSTAKIFAKTINCLNPQNGEPCNECEMCISADNGSNMNIAEIDAASNNKVDDARIIIDEVKYPPVNGKYKVYIIDEVHMLTIQAFNALLKTLEEPPEYAVFILATTDPQKVPVTILSRCQRYDFKRIAPQEIADTLKSYMEKENISVSTDALEYISAVSDGAMRDSLSILDRCIAYYSDEEITVEKVMEITGSVDKGIFFDLTDALTEFNGKKCMDIIADAVANGRDISQMVSEFINHLRNDLVALSGGKLDTSAQNIEKYAEQGNKTGKNALIKYITAFSELTAKMKYSSAPRTLFEVECIKLCNALDEETITDIVLKVNMLEKKLESGVTVQRHFEPKESKEPEEEVFEPIREKIEPEMYKKIKEIWKSVISESSISKTVKPSAEYKPLYLEDRFIYITYDSDASGEVNKLIKDKAKEDANSISDALSRAVKKKIEVRVITEDEYKEKDRKLRSKPAEKTAEQLNDEMSAKDMLDDLSTSLNYEVEEE